MRVRSFITVVVGLLPCIAALSQPAASQSFDELAAQCAPDIHPSTLKAVVSTESSWNPYAIGVVGGKLERQPRNLAEAIAAAHELERQDFNFSLGLGQVNRHNLAKHGETYATVFEPCRNLKVGGAILKDCFQRAQRITADEQSALRAAFSCYFSGNFTRGFRPDSAGQPSYVQKVVANAPNQATAGPMVPAIEPQSSDGPAAVRTTVRQVERTKQAETPSRWVVFVVSTRQSDPPEVQLRENATNESTVKVRPVKPTPFAAHSAPVEQTTGESMTQALVPLLKAASSDQQEPSFVQFVN